MYVNLEVFVVICLLMSLGQCGKRFGVNCIDNDFVLPVPYYCYCVMLSEE